MPDLVKLNARRIVTWTPPWQWRGSWQAWVFYSWPCAPLVDGYRRLGTGLRGYRILGIEVDYVDRVTGEPL